MSKIAGQLHTDIDASCIVNMTYSTNVMLEPHAPVALRLRSAAFLPANFDVSNYQLSGVNPCRSLPSLAQAPDGCNPY